MNQKECLTILGARPQFIKAPLLSKELKKQGWNELLVHTGQHYDYNMSELFFNELDLPIPHYNLGISGGTHSEMVSKMLLQISQLIHEYSPQCVIVYGDTNSTLAGALAAAQSNTPLVHIEAGLRSYCKEMPEEQNRKLTDHLSDYLFCPTQRAVENLKCEGITKGVCFSGDLMFEMAKLYQEDNTILESLNIKPKSFHLFTAHRAEICNNLDFLREVLNWVVTYHNKPVIWPIHPRMKSILSSSTLMKDIDLSLMHIIEPVGYYQMMSLIKNSVSVFTDSGGVQREAYFHETPCITLRNETEWPETIEAGWNKLWPSKQEPFSYHNPPDYFFKSTDFASKMIVDYLNNRLA